MTKIGLIGMGNMGSAILNGLLSAFPKKDLMFTCRRKEHAEEIEKTTGVASAADNAVCAKNADILILAVKPQVYPAVLAEIAPALKKKQIVISIAPGITSDSLKEKLGADKRIVRAMPNTPAQLKAGMTGISYADGEFSAAEKELLDRIFTSFGRVRKVDEKLIDTVMLVAGSSPAFVYMFIDALADAGVKYGLTKRDALEMAAQTVYGCAKMVMETGEHPAVLKDKVCSPGGTTIEGVSVLENKGFRGAVISACDAVHAKGRKLG